MDEEVRHIWHVYSDGTRTEAPFDTDGDKVYAWNSAAICAEFAGVGVLVVTVTGTQLHTMVRGEAEKALRFKTVLQQRLAKRFGRMHFASFEVTTRREALTKFMFIYRLCMDSYGKLPGEYPWGPGNIYFAEPRKHSSCNRVGDLSLRTQFSLFSTKRGLPEEWLADADGRIRAESFIDIASVERLFRTARTFIACLHVRRKDEAALKREIHHNYLASRSIKELRRIGNEYCTDVCGKTLVKVDIRIRLAIAARMIRDGIACRSPELAKALLLRPHDLRLPD